MSYATFKRQMPRVVRVAALLAAPLWAPTTLAGPDPGAGAGPRVEELETTVRCIATLEGKRDPKCYATASRLEDFITGTPLSDGARTAKIALQKNMVNRIWSLADASGRAAGSTALSAGDLQPVIATICRFRNSDSGGWIVETADGKDLTIEARDKRQYSTVAYGLRAILAVQQERLLERADSRLPLDTSATEKLKDFLDLYSLAALRIANEDARLSDRSTIGAEALERAWERVGTLAPMEKAGGSATPKRANGTGPPSFEMTKHIIAQKMASYEEYNQIALPVFLRNIQVYFARHLWPTDPELSNQLKATFTEAMISYAGEFLLGAEEISRRRGRTIVQLDDVSQFAGTFIPHRLNEFEDATFFPRFPAPERVTIEAYDMDAFRDSGLHWQYLQAAIAEPDFQGTLEPDPFALELIAENIAQFGVLVLRIAGRSAAAEGVERLADRHIEMAMHQIQDMVARHATLPEEAKKSSPIASARQNLPAGDSRTYFTNVTEEYNLRFTHRSSDWLNRLIRTYTVRNKSVAVLAVPPAFGGSGVAAEDINEDGLPDLLLLGGGGTQLLLNNGSGTLTDITEQAGVAWVRDDGFPGETRQPIIADFDNDGLQDILITYVNDRHRLYRNTGGARFEDVTGAAGLGGEGMVGGPAVTVDYDNDGLLDLYITYFGQYIEGILPTLARRNANGLPNRLFRNTGNMHFEDVTERSGVAGVGWTQAAAHTDINLDGWQDLIEGNDFGVNAYYLNQGDGTFKDAAATLLTGKPSYTMSIGIADLNRDRYPDFYISNIVTMDKDQKYVDPGDGTPMKFDAKTMAAMRVVEANDLFVSERSSGALTYVQSDAVTRGLASTGWAWGADFFDFDNDGDDDLYVANGMNDYAVYSSENPYYQDPAGMDRNVRFAESTSESNVFFVNEGGRLAYRSGESGADLHGNSRAVAYADLDRDGDLDMVLNNYHEPATIFRNNSERFGHHVLRIRLVGDPARKTPRDAIGAKLLVTTPDGSTIWREVHGGGGYLTMQPKEQYFGLGDFTSADLAVTWPNGQVQESRGLEGDRRHTIVQTTGVPVAAAR